jgi:hypothetical protein
MQISIEYFIERKAIIITRLPRRLDDKEPPFKGFFICSLANNVKAL